MAQRPVFITSLNDALLVRTESVAFEWFSGLAISQKQRSIDSLHDAARLQCGLDRVLEISSKSKDWLGIELSAFNLVLRTSDRPCGVSVECAFQGSKVFERGGPYIDLFDKTSREAKQDERLQNSGRLVRFRFEDYDWPLEPRTAFYNWLYITALMQHPQLIERLEGYAAFTDIEFNPERSINCQAYAVALYISLARRGALQALRNGRDAYLHVLDGHAASNAGQDTYSQGTLF